MSESAASPVLVDREGEAKASARSPGELTAPRALSERARAERRLGLFLTLPAVVVMLAVTAYPIAYSVWLSLQRYDLRFPQERAFVGLRNYIDVLTARLWWSDFFTTLIITVASVVLELVLGMAIALVMHRTLFGRRTVRTSILIPYGIVTVVAGLAWRYAFSPDVGFINHWLGIERDLLATRWSALTAIVLTDVWKTVPFMALLLLAGLALVPEELHEAARVDGATTWQRFTRITLPIIKPAILVALLFRALDAFRIFDAIFVLTSGANNTESVSLLGYNQLINRLNLGIGSAVSVLIFLCVVLIAFLFVKGFGTSLAQQRGER